MFYEISSFSFAIYFLNVSPNYVLNRLRKKNTFNIIEKSLWEPQQSGGIYSRNVARMKTGNVQRDMVRRPINLDFKNN